MSIRIMSRVWEFSQHGGTNLLMLLGIGDFCDDDGRAFPSVPKLAKKCRIGERHAVRVLQILEESGELRVQKNAGPRGTNLYRILIRGVTSTSPLTPESPLTPASVGGDIQVQKGVPPMSPESSLTIKEPPVSAKPRKGGRLKSEKRTFRAWYEEASSVNPEIFAKDDPVHGYMTKVGMNYDFLLVHWFWFKGKQLASTKLQADWLQTFRNSVKGNYGRLWYRTNEGIWKLTTAGKQAALEHDCDENMTSGGRDQFADCI